MTIEVRNISKTFGNFNALDNVSLRVDSGELVALLGPSGSGKTTLLRVIAGLEVADEGSGPVFFDSRDVTDKSVRRRAVGFVFQHYALFRHMTVFENIAFGLRVKPRRNRPAKEEIEKRVTELLKLIQLESLKDRYPSQLSGGQRQRVALARALAIEPKVLLLDEPFGALDAKVRQELRKWLRRLHDEIHVTSVFVTHDQEEALELADRVVVMNHGKIEQIGTPDEVFHNPASEFVMNFLGSVNFFHGRVEKGSAVFGSLVVPDVPHDEGVMLRLFARPHEMEIVKDAGGKGGIKAKVERIQTAGPHVKIELMSETGQAVIVEMAHEKFKPLGIAAGNDVFVRPLANKMFIKDSESLSR